MKRIKLLTPIVLATTMVGTTLPLASCSNTTDHVSITLSGKSKTIEVGQYVNYIFSLDKDGYTVQDIQISIEGEHSSDLSFKATISNNLLVLKVGCAQPYDSNVTYMFNVKFSTNSWKQDVSGLTLKVNGAAQSELVDTVNEWVNEIGPQKTFSNLISELKTKSFIKTGYVFDLETEPTGKDNTQWAWDKEANVIFAMNSNNSIAIAPKSYKKMSDNKANIWKMVKAKSSSNALLNSATNETTLIDEFDENSQFSQYLRSDSDFSGTLQFCSGLDAGAHENLNLVYNKAESSSNDAVVINTIKSTLTVNGSLSDIEHYGNLTELTVESLGTSDYTEYGTVDATIVVKSGSIVLEDGSSVNSVIIDSDTTEGISISANEGSEVGTIGATDKDIIVELEQEGSIVIDEDAEVGNVERTKDIETPDPNPEADFYSGDGTENFPYTIKNKHQLNKFAEKVANRSSADDALYFNLIADINYENDDHTPGEWTPVGTDDKPFKGIFNGCGFKISNIKYVAESEEEKTEHLGFFGYTKGSENSAYTNFTDVWDDELDETNIEEKLYDTVIKNITIENVTAINHNKYFVGGLVGAADNTYFYNCNVKSGTINGLKHVGGLVGTMGGCICKDCTVGGDDNELPLSIITDVYHVGGIAGSSGYERYDKQYCPVKAWTCFAFINCTTGSNCTIEAKAASSGGTIGGMVGDNQSARACVYDGCVNNANIVVTSPSKTDGPSYVGGIAAFGQNVEVINNCLNTGNITINEGSGCQNVAGITTGSNTEIKILNCINTGHISGYATAMAGIAAACNPPHTIEGCISSIDLLTNSNPDGLKQEIWC